ncbi:DNA-binding protein [Egibacter rhizosphaerae]|uniref:DNA-binding protein n=1 Tax=Egibacter rhizosphaerae TaxID=1670831 RepID=A0A411YE22_9ACTN|nr:helix-turn-helix domain-containing protein [Egibacter rhizosphaerae]QBI19377.1 DNA-binding protein [Egibacter rhizosphaerae]
MTADNVVSLPTPTTNTEQRIVIELRLTNPHNPSEADHPLPADPFPPTSGGEWAIKITDAAERLGISDSHIRKLIKNGEIPSVDLGGAVRVPLEPLADYLNEQARKRMQYPH